MKKVSKLTVRDIADDIGREKLAEALSLKNYKSVQPAIASGLFPPGWYKVVKALAKKKGIEVPENLFNWRQPAVDDNHTAA